MRRKFLMGQVMDLRRLRAAYEAVRSNRGEPGVGGVTVDAFGADLEANLVGLVAELRAKKGRAGSTRELDRGVECALRESPNDRRPHPCGWRKAYPTQLHPSRDGPDGRLYEIDRNKDISIVLCTAEMRGWKYVRTSELLIPIDIPDDEVRKAGSVMEDFTDVVLKSVKRGRGQDVAGEKK